MLNAKKLGFVYIIYFFLSTRQPNVICPLSLKAYCAVELSTVEKVQGLHTLHLKEKEIFLPSRRVYFLLDHLVLCAQVV